MHQVEENSVHLHHQPVSGRRAALKLFNSPVRGWSARGPNPEAGRRSEVMPSRVAHVTQLAMGKANICGIRCVAHTGNSKTPAESNAIFLRGGP